MEPMGSHRYLRFVTFFAFIGLFVCVGGPRAHAALCSAAIDCGDLMPPLIPVTDPNYNAGFQKDIEIPFYIDRFASHEEAAQIEAAFSLWQDQLETAGKHFIFVKTTDPDLAASSGIEVVIGTTPPGEPANFRVISKDPDTHELRAARITIDLRGGLAAGMLYFDPQKPGYEAHGSSPGAVAKAIMHEVGHALGLHHFGGKACTEQLSGASVMNGMCGINDFGAILDGVPRPPALANRPAPCDVAAVPVVASATSHGGRSRSSEH